ncbi:MAG TPA: hypothetical protein VMV27_00890 [Candidatus Binataceae bacterium]|nr:hypothetical protein [Candidatus Binataceae bacterium]
MEQSKRGITLTILPALFILAAISDILKPFHLEGPTTGFVFFGTRTHGLENAVLGPLFGILLIIYAIGILRMKKYALPLAFLYAIYVVVNIVLYSVNPPPGDQDGAGFLIAFTIFAIGVPWLAAILLWRRRAGLA